MYPPIYAFCIADSGVTDLISTRLYPAGAAPQGVTLPYAVWQSVGGVSENYLGQAPDMDSITLQIDCYDAELDGARDVARAIREAIEGQANITGLANESRDPDTKHYRYLMTVDWFVDRETSS